jgi:SAM-dependent methyltransferase
MALKDILKHPVIYQTYQDLGGFHGGRVKALASYAPMKGGERVVDIGCGPGFIVRDLPPNVSYLGFDTDERYIAYAKGRFGRMGRFFCQTFDRTAASEHGPVDIVMMNGVLHHLSDEEVRETLPAIRAALGNGGRLVTIDGCFVDGQSWIARTLLRNDRGQHVRTRPHYESLMRGAFDHVEVHIEDSLSRIPYTFIVMVGTL